MPGQTGMTLRDWFASQASEDDILFHRHYEDGGAKSRLQAITREEARFAFADAMLRAREDSQ